jgi:hypothetical protein
MGKRSGFERREADFYPTPRAAVVPQIPHLRGTRSFAEPCAGDGALVRHLEAKGLRCVYSGDMLIRSSFVLFASHLISASERAGFSRERSFSAASVSRQPRSLPAPP